MSHDPSEIILISWFGAYETFIFISVKNCCAAWYFCGNCDTFFRDSLMNRKFKRAAIIWNSHPNLLNGSVCLTLLYCASFVHSSFKFKFKFLVICITLVSYSCFYRISVLGLVLVELPLWFQDLSEFDYQQVCKRHLAYWDWSASGVLPLLNVTNVNFTNQICCCHKSDGQLLVSFHDADVLSRKSAPCHCWLTVETMTDWYK